MALTAGLITAFDIVSRLIGAFGGRIQPETRENLNGLQEDLAAVLDALEPAARRAFELKWQERMERRASDPRLNTGANIDELRIRSDLMREMRQQIVRDETGPPADPPDTVEPRPDSQWKNTVGPQDT